MTWRKSVCKLLRNGASQSSRPRVAPSFSSSMADSNPIESLQTYRIPDDRRRRNGPEMQRPSSHFGRESYGTSSRVIEASGTGWNWMFSGTMEACSSGRGSLRIAGLHAGRVAKAPVEPTYGVGPVRGADRDPKTKGSTPDDFRAEDIHMAEPKEITKEKAAIAQEETPDFQVKKAMPQWAEAVYEEADAQRESGDKVFEGETRKLAGSAEKKGDTTGLESDEKIDAQYGSTPSEGSTKRG